MGYRLPTSSPLESLVRKTSQRRTNAPAEPARPPRPPGSPLIRSRFEHSRGDSTYTTTSTSYAGSSYSIYPADASLEHYPPFNNDSYIEMDDDDVGVAAGYAYDPHASQPSYDSALRDSWPDAKRMTADSKASRRNAQSVYSNVDSVYSQDDLPTVVVSSPAPAAPPPGRQPIVAQPIRNYSRPMPTAPLPPPPEPSHSRSTSPSNPPSHSPAPSPSPSPRPALVASASSRAVVVTQHAPLPAAARPVRPYVSTEGLEEQKRAVIERNRMRSPNAGQGSPYGSHRSPSTYASSPSVRNVSGGSTNSMASQSMASLHPSAHSGAYPSSPKPNPYMTHSPSPSGDLLRGMSSGNSRAPSPYSTSQRAPSPYSTSQRAPSPYDLNDRAPSPYDDAQRAASPYGGAQRAASPYASAPEYPPSTTGGQSASYHPDPQSYHPDPQPDAAQYATGDGAQYATGDGAQYATGDAAQYATGDAAQYATGDAAQYATGDAAQYATGDAAQYASYSNTDDAYDAESLPSPYDSSASPYHSPASADFEPVSPGGGQYASYGGPTVTGHGRGPSSGSPQYADGLSPRSVDGLSPRSADNLSPQSADGLSPRSVDGLSPRSVDGLSPQSADGLSHRSADGLSPQYASYPQGQGHARGQGHERSGSGGSFSPREVRDGAREVRDSGYAAPGSSSTLAPPSAASQANGSRKGPPPALLSAQGSGNTSHVALPSGPPSRPLTPASSVYSDYSYYPYDGSYTPNDGRASEPGTPMGGGAPVEGRGHRASDSQATVNGNRHTPSDTSRHKPSESQATVKGQNGLLSPAPSGFSNTGPRTPQDGFGPGPRTPQDFLAAGIAAHEANKLEESARLFERSATTAGGCGVGMLMYGLALRHGWGVRKDERGGFRWLRRAAEMAVRDLEGELGGEGVAMFPEASHLQGPPHLPGYSEKPNVVDTSPRSPDQHIRSPTASALSPTTSPLSPTTSPLSPTTSTLSPDQHIHSPDTSTLSPKASTLSPKASTLSPKASTLSPTTSPSSSTKKKRLLFRSRSRGPPPSSPSTAAATEKASAHAAKASMGMDRVNDGVQAELVLAIYEVGQCFFHGWGVPKDQKMGVSYYTVAARLGDADAQSDLAFCLANGRGCKKDRKAAARWYRAAVAQGQSDIGLAWIYKEKFQ